MKTTWRRTCNHMCGRPLHLIVRRTVLQRTPQDAESGTSGITRHTSTCLRRWKDLKSEERWGASVPSRRHTEEESRPESGMFEDNVRGRGRHRKGVLLLFEEPEEKLWPTINYSRGVLGGSMVLTTTVSRGEAVVKTRDSRTRQRCKKRGGVHKIWGFYVPMRSLWHISDPS